MKPKMRRNLSGTFVAQNLQEGAWRLARSEPAPIDVLVRGVEPGAADVFRSPSLLDVDIEWQSATVVLTMTSAGRRRSVKTQSAIVHEPLVHLYDALPLVILDAKARRFWHRVFRLVRIPGGRYLLGAMARRTRSARR
jgi:hypothetical protein